MAKETTKLAPRPLKTPTDLPNDSAAAVSKALNGLLADAFALYLKTRTSTGTSAARTSATII